MRGEKKLKSSIFPLSFQERGLGGEVTCAEILDKNFLQAVVFTNYISVVYLLPSQVNA